MIHWWIASMFCLIAGGVGFLFGATCMYYGFKRAIREEHESQRFKELRVKLDNMKKEDH